MRSARALTIRTLASMAGVAMMLACGKGDPADHAVSGSVTPPPLASNTRARLVGEVVATAVVREDGTYTFTGVPNGSYVVTPAKAGYAFDPAERSVAVHGADVTGVDFAVRSATHRLAGTLGAEGAGASVALSGAASLATTADASGAFSFDGLAPGSYTVTPSKAGYAFSPPSQGATIGSADVTGVSFIATLITYSLSGTVGPAGAGALIQLGGAATGSATADATGGFAFAGLVPGRYTVTPSKAGYLFTPGSRDVTLTTADATGIDFAAAVQTFTVSGTILPGANAAGTVVTLVVAPSDATVATTTVTATGAYALRAGGPGAYTVTPSKAGFTFGPASRAFAFPGETAGLDFAAVSNTSNVTVNASLRFQRMAGMGTNVNANSWKGGELGPALDQIVQVNGSSLLRVIRDPMDWVGSESQIEPLRALDPAVLAQVYEAPRMQDLWSTVAYLNQLGLRGDQLVLNFMGWTPTWLGGSGRYGQVSYVTPGKEDALATMIASLVHYGKRVRGLDFSLVSPLNEPDLNGLEGPLVGPSQYATIAAALATALEEMGLGDVRIVGPDTASGPDGYASPLLSSPAAAARLAALGFHRYQSDAAPGAYGASRPYWLTETADWCSTCDQGGELPASSEWAFSAATSDFILSDLANGIGGVLVWEAYDSWWYHHASDSTWGLLSYDQAAGRYAPRKRFYTNAQLNRVVRDGMVRVATTTSVTPVRNLVAFHDETTGRISVTGHNESTTSSVTLNVRLQNLPSPPAALAHWETSRSRDLERGPDVVLVGSSFAVTVPPDTFFSLTSAPP